MMQVKGSFGLWVCFNFKDIKIKGEEDSPFIFVVGNLEKYKK